LPLLLGMHATDADKRRLLDLHAQTGPPDVGHSSTHVAYVADTHAEAQHVLCAAMPDWLATTAEYVRIDATTTPTRNPHGYLEHLLDIHPVGSPDLCARRLADTVATTGARRLLLMVEGAGIPARTLTNLARLGAEVLPILRHYCT
jgi:hypothetical protein